MKSYRLNRLFNARSNRCFDVAVDHGFFNERGFLQGKEKPALVLRTDVANVYGTQLPRALFSRMIEQPVEQALRLDATCVVVNLFRIPEQPEVTDQCIQNILRLKPECDRFGMPLMIEPLVFQPTKRPAATWWTATWKKSCP